ncbi:anaerobic ribonucleoside-triphosphate reductase activating protein [Flavobacterium enshiense DK69]|uniref:Radical SAM protein n=1 Tax=Flavobacterium enshiense DK69 TaxID=1107311 RepID=V6SAA3_9FLAO|nr:anaerobic ribonucleoside-triphosphate reductase activating protein [Flavobacterium enshiense]ESU23379.1 anaerobic ribonucleoside-triphosphate reductase activating protein [Flavobacterium enshiense DK69]KGO96392.1 radical SAM protein [Flavobacterium enshiense DK69]
MLSKPISDITPFTLLDYPGKSACIFWYAGCNMRCSYCYNPEIVLGKGRVLFSEAISFLDTRRGLLDAVVLSGGECLIHKNIQEQIKAIKKMGYLIKIDTNGSNPGILSQLLEEGLIDYVALDFKALDDKYEMITKSDLFSPFEQSLQLLLNSKVTFEVRTTCHSDLLASSDLNKMIHYLDSKGYEGNFYIQGFRNDKETLGKLSSSQAINPSELFSLPNIQFVIR